MSGRIEGMGIPFDATFGGARRHCHCGPPGCPPKAVAMAVRLAEAVASH